MKRKCKTVKFVNKYLKYFLTVPYLFQQDPISALCQMLNSDPDPGSALKTGGSKTLVRTYCVREYPGVERTGEELMEVGREGGDGRKQLDENWSLGPARELAPHALGNVHF